MSGDEVNGLLDRLELLPVLSSSGGLVFCEDI